MQIKPSELAKLQKQFDRLVTRTRQRVVSKAVRETMKPVLSDARSRVPQGGTGTLRQATKLKVKGYRRNGFVVGIVGVSNMSKVVNGRKVQPSKYAHLVEYGTQAHSVKKAKVMTNGSQVFGKHVRGAPARPFLRPAFDGNRKSMERDVRKRIGRGIESIAKGL